LKTTQFFDVVPSISFFSSKCPIFKPFCDCLELKVSSWHELVKHRLKCQIPQNALITSGINTKNCKLCHQDPDIADPESPTMISEFIIFNREREIERKDREEREAAWEKELLQVCHPYLSFLLSSSAQCATQYLLLSLVRERRLPAAPLAAAAFTRRICFCFASGECKLYTKRSAATACQSAFFHLRFATTRAEHTAQIIDRKCHVLQVYAYFASASQVTHEIQATKCREQLSGISSLECLKCELIISRYATINLGITSYA
jgi:hypothetical protein